MTELSPAIMTYTISCIAGGFLAGWVARSQLEKRLRGGSLGRDPLVMNEGRVHRGNGNGGPATPKPNIVPKPQPTGGRVIDVWGCIVGYIPRSQGGTPNPPQPAAGAPIAYKTLFTAYNIVADSWCNTEKNAVCFRALENSWNKLSPGDYIKIAHEKGCEPHSGCTTCQPYEVTTIANLGNGFVEITAQPLPDREVR